MEKDFDRWNDQKKVLNKKDKGFHFHEREVWWCSLGVNVGSEQDGVNDKFERPVLIVKKFNRWVLWVVPLTRTLKHGPYYYPLEFDNNPSAVVLSQLRLISSKRLVRKIRTIDRDTYLAILHWIIHLLKNEMLSTG